jgi:hypothetical protein
MKWVGIYGGFFLLMLVVALAVTGILQQRLLPLVTGWGRHPAVAGPTETPGAPVAAAESAAATSAPAPPTGETRPKPGEDGDPGGPRVADPPAAVVRPVPSPAPRESAEEGAAPAKRLAQVYESMRPKEAAAVLEKLDRPMAAQVLAEIRARQLSKILGAMNPAAAADVTRLLAQTAERRSP